jgi:hypothetical protein
MSQETERTMSLFSTIRSPDHSRLPRDRSVEVPRASLTEDVEEQFSLPRHLLVCLAEITADAASLQERCVDTPQLHAPLGRMLDTLGGLVDSIYGRAPQTPTDHSVPGHQSSAADNDHGRRQPWESASESEHSS